MGAKVLAGAVDSELGRYAFAVACREAVDRGGELHVVGHLEPPRSDSSADAYDLARRRSSEEVERFVAAAPGAPGCPGRGA